MAEDIKPKPEETITREQRFERNLKITQLIANIAISISILTVFLSIVQYSYTQSHNRKSKALEAITNIYDKDFIRDLDYIVTAIDLPDSAHYIYDRIKLRYYLIAYLHNNNLVDKDIINSTLKRGLSDFLSCDIVKRDSVFLNSYEWELIDKMHINFK